MGWGGFYMVSPTNMNDMPGIIDHDISVVAILKFQEPRDDRICRHALQKVVPSLLLGIRAA